MKKKLLIALLAIVSAFACVFGVVGCFSRPSDNGGNQGGNTGGNTGGNQGGNTGGNTGNTGGETSNEYTVTFDSNGGKFASGDVDLGDDVTFDDGSTVSSDGKKLTVTVLKGGLLAPPLKIPERSGYAFDGWYSDAECENEYTFDMSPISGGLTLYAKWSITFNYALSADKSYYIVKGIGGLSGDVEVPDTYNLLPVLEIADGAFSKCSKLTGIKIADSVTKIGDSAFSECKNLVSVTLGNGVTEIGAHAFDGGWTGSGLKEITIPKTVEYIGGDAFSVCDNLEKITYGGTANDWCEIEFEENTADGSAVLANRKTKLYIGDKPVTEVTINTERVNDLAFSGYEVLTSVTLGANVKYVGKNAFSFCSITTLNIAGATSLKEIGEKAFASLRATSLKLPETDTYIAKEAFKNCNYLTSLDLGGATRVGEDAFNGISTLSSLDLGCVEEIYEHGISFNGYPASVTLPSSLWYIGKNNFGNIKLFSFETPSTWYANFSQNYAYSGSSASTVTEISSEQMTSRFKQPQYSGGDWVKKAGTVTTSTSGSTVTATGVTANCYGGIYIPANVTNIASGALNSSYIKAVSVGLKVKQIDSGAFSGCSSLKMIKIVSTHPEFCVVDGVLYNKAQTQIVCVPDKLEGSVNVPEGITSVGIMFSGHSGITRLLLPYSLKTIDSSALKGCTNLELLMLTGVTSIPDGLLSDCNGLKEIIITAVTGEIPLSEFSDMNDLLSIEVGTYNENYASVDGVLYNKDKTKIIYVPNGLKVLNVPETVTEIGWSGGASLKEINFVGNNDKYSSSNGVVYNKDATEIIYIPNGIAQFTIPSTINRIDSRNLDKCTSLKSISVATGNKNYASRGGLLYDKELTKVIYIPKGIKELTYEMFGKNNELAEIVIPDSVTSIGDYAFQNCSGLKSITIPENVTSIGENAFYKCYGLKTVYWNAIACISAGSVFDPIFEECINLTNIIIGKNVASIPDLAFYECRGLTSIMVNENNASFKSENNCLLSKDGKNLILGCRTSIIPQSVTTIGDRAFEYCSGLTSVTIPDSVTSIGSEAFYGCSGVTSIIIPDSVTSIGNRAFEYCSGLTSVTIGNGVASIGGAAFASCWRLTSIMIPNSVTSISNVAFEYCSGLTSITIPDSVTSIGSHAFNGCRGLKTIYCEAAEKPSGWSGNWNKDIAGKEFATVWRYKPEEN